MQQTRDRYVTGQAPDWSRPAQRWEPFDQPDSRRAPMAERRQYTASDVSRSYLDGVRNGWVGAAGFYVLITVCVILAFHWLGGAA